GVRGSRCHSPGQPAQPLVVLHGSSMARFGGNPLRFSREPLRPVNPGRLSYVFTKGSLPRTGNQNRSGKAPMTRFPPIAFNGARRTLWTAATIVSAGALATVGVTTASASSPHGSYRQINMVSDQAHKAPLKDKDLVNAWGLAASPGTNDHPGSPLW